MSEDTCEFKVGDRGKTRGGDAYEITAKGRYCFLVEINDWEEPYTFDGKWSAWEDVKTHGCPRQYDLLPPLKGVKGWMNLYSHLPLVAGKSTVVADTSFVYATKEAADAAKGKSTRRRVACIYIDAEEGEGL